MTNKRKTIFPVNSAEGDKIKNTLQDINFLADWSGHYRSWKNIGQFPVKYFAVVIIITFFFSGWGLMYMQEELNKPILLEINTLPGLTKHSLVPKIAQNNDLDFDNLITKIIEDAFI